MGVLREYSQGPFRLAGQRRRADAPARRRHDLDPPPAARAEHLEDPRRVALGGGRRPPQEPGERLSPHRRDRARARPIAAARPASIPSRSRRGCRPRGASGWSGCWTGWPSRASTRRSSSGWASTWPSGRPRRSPGSGRSPWPSGSGSIPTRSSPPACTARARACSSCTGTCSARSAVSPARSRTRSARSPSMPTARPATSTSSSTSPTRSS